MVYIIAAGIVICLCAVLARKKSVKTEKFVIKAPKNELADICTLLYNIEIYDGSSKGQKKAEVNTR